MSALLRRQGVPQNTVAPKFVGDTGEVYKSTYIDYGQIDSHSAGEDIPIGRGVYLDVNTNKVFLGTNSDEEKVLISGIVSTDLYDFVETYGENSTPAVMKKGYIGVEMEIQPLDEFAPIYMDKTTGQFFGLKEEGLVEVLNVNIIPTWSNTSVAVLYISRGKLHKNKET